MSLISITELSKQTGIEASHISHLIRRGILPQGKKEGRFTFLPEAEAKLILATHAPGEHWVKGRKRVKPWWKKLV